MLKSKTFIYISTIITLLLLSIAVFVTDVSAWYVNNIRFSGETVTIGQTNLHLSVEKWDEDKNDWQSVDLDEDNIFELQLNLYMLFTDDVRHVYRFTVTNLSSEDLYVALNYGKGHGYQNAQNLLCYTSFQPADNTEIVSSEIKGLSLRLFDFSADASNDCYVSGEGLSIFLINADTLVGSEESASFYLCFGFNLPIVLEALRSYGGTIDGNGHISAPDIDFSAVINITAFGSTGAVKSQGGD